MLYHEFNNGMKIPMVGFGTFPLHGDQLVNAMKDAGCLGYTLFDTAIAYQNEKEIGALVKNKVIDKGNIFITSKVNLPTLKGRKKYLYLNRKSIRKAYDDSCLNLNVTKLGAYLLHYPFDGCSKYYKDLMKLFDEGKVGVIGVSNFDIRELKELYKKCGRWPMMNQTEISPYNSQKDLIQFCKDNGILVQAYSPFGRGNLVQEILSDKTLLTIAEFHGKTVGQIVLRFIVQQDVAVVVRSTNYNRLKDNISIFDFELSKEEMDQIYSLNRNVVFGVNQVGKYNKPLIKI